jgi:hypothetical protein
MSAENTTKTYVTEHQLLNTSYALIAVTSVFAIARLTTRVLHAKAWVVEDYLVYLAFAFYIAMSVLYIVVTPAMFRLAKVTSGTIPPYPTLITDALFITKIFFANSMVFWFVLWSIKFSLLALYRRLMVGLHNAYMKAWWGVFVFCALVRRSLDPSSHCRDSYWDKLTRLSRLSSDALYRISPHAIACTLGLLPANVLRNETSTPNLPVYTTPSQSMFFQI